MHRFIKRLQVVLHRGSKVLKVGSFFHDSQGEISAVPVSLKCWKTECFKFYFDIQYVKAYSTYLKEAFQQIFANLN